MEMRRRSMVKLSIRKLIGPTVKPVMGIAATGPCAVRGGRAEVNRFIGAAPRGFCESVRTGITGCRHV